MERETYNALVLNDYEGMKHYATWVEQQVKTIETRMKTFKYRGDLVICCGNKSVTANAGKALCIVNLYDAEPMRKEHEKAACIEVTAGRIAHHLKDWRFFNRKFSFSRQKVSGAFQSIFQITLPEDVRIIKPLPIVKVSNPTSPQP